MASFAVTTRRADKVSDVLRLLAVIKDAYRGASGDGIKELRLRAVDEIAKSELHAGRFTSFISARNTLMDACARRLKPDIEGTDQFDELVDAWLRGGSTSLKNILLRHAANRQVERLVIDFFAEAAADG